MKWDALLEKQNGFNMAEGVDGGPLLVLTEGISSTFEVFLDKGLCYCICL